MQPPLFAIEFVSWELLLEQLVKGAGGIVLLMAIAWTVFNFSNAFSNIDKSTDDFIIRLGDAFSNIDKSTDDFIIRQPSPRDVSFHFREDALSREASGPRQKMITADVERALNERITQHIKCPYCNQNNLTSALTCIHCGGQL
jgi:hypothetical protein